ncbi:MAG TPA: AAA family ATPase [Lentzea sp.]
MGRGDEVACLRGRVQELAGGRGAVVLVEGEPGIGKSTLLSIGLGDATALGCRRLWAVGDELSQHFPLRALLKCFDADEKKEVLGDGGDVISWGLSSVDPVPAAVERLLVLMDRLCAASPVVLVFDDLQWAHESSLLVMSRLSRLVDQLPLLLVGACRPVPRRPEVRSMRRTAVTAGATVIRLEPLEEPLALTMVEELIGVRAGPGLRRLSARAGGNPLYVRELLDVVLRQGWGVVDPARTTMDVDESVANRRAPASLTAAIARRLDFLSADVSRPLRIAALLGAEFSVTELAAVTNTPATRLADPLEEARAAEVLVESGDRLGFRHPLVRTALQESLPQGMRSAIHGQIARRLARAGAPAERVATHLVAATDVLESWALDWILGTGAELTRRAPEIEADLLRRAADRIPVDDPRRELLEDLLTGVLGLLARHGEVEQLARSALPRARTRAHAALMACSLSQSLMRTGRLTEALTVVERMLADNDDPDASWLARLRAVQAVLLQVLGRFDEVYPAARRALAEGEQHGDKFAMGLALHAMSTAADCSDAALGLKFIDRALNLLGDDPHSTDLAFVMLANRSAGLHVLDRLREARATLDDTLRRAERVASPRLPQLQSMSAVWHFLNGTWDDAIADLETAMGGNVLTVDLSRVLKYRIHGLYALIAAHRDQRRTTATQLRALRDAPITAGMIRDNAVYLIMARALAQERARRPHDALAELLPALDAGVAKDMMMLHLVLPHVVRLAIETGDRTTAQTAAEMSADYSERDDSPARLAAAQWCRGLLDGDPAPVLATADHFRAVGRPLDLGQSLEDRAVLLAEQGDQHAARPAFDEALEIYRGLGASWDTLRAVTRLRPFGIRQGERGPRRRPKAGWTALTPTELKVAALVAQGCSNPDIAADLFLSRRTVQTHVSHILAKLSVRSRDEIAREALRQPVPENRSTS